MIRSVDLNDGWIFNKDFLCLPEGETVRIPHTVCVTPFHYFGADSYQMVSGYRKVFFAPEDWIGKRVFILFEGIAHYAEVFLNGKKIAEHKCGYTSFEAELTEGLVINDDNEIVVKADSRESLNIPPFGNVIDYMTYGGIYREVTLVIREQNYIKDVFVRSTANGSLYADVSFANEQEDFRVAVTDPDTGRTLCEMDGTKGYVAISKVPDIKKWDLDDPKLYILKVSSKSDSYEVRFGFRDSEFRADGYYLNGKKIKIRGLNRHQSYPFVGYAMPGSMQRYDADILKYEIGVNAVRTSHYPQSRHFIDRCDEIGILVFTEIPGWQHIGDKEWQEQAINNVCEMVEQYRNHPSIILWGVRINESVDNDELYSRTNDEARHLDPTRPTGGVRYLKNSSFLEDVYTYNDFVHDGTLYGCEPKKKVTSDMNRAYLISEYNGHMFPTKTFDSEEHRTEHMLRHANVLDCVAGYDDIAGSFGWCMFDYNTHKDFGSGDHICYHGVCDMFRNGKLASKVYAAAGGTGDPVLEVSSSMDIGEHPAGNRGRIYIITDCDYVKMYKNDCLIKEYTHKDSRYKNLRNAPILIDDYVGDAMKEKEGFTDRQNKIVNEALNYIGQYGMSNIPLKIKLKLMEAMAIYHMKMEDAYMLYQRYIGSWGGEATVFKFEGIRNGQVVKTVIKTTGSKVKINAICSSDSLKEDHTYDVASIRIRITDEYGNVLPFFNTPLPLEVTGDAELIGPSNAVVAGGMGGTYLRSIGKTGEAKLIIHLPEGYEDDPVTLTFKTVGK